MKCFERIHTKNETMCYVSTNYYVLISCSGISEEKTLNPVQLATMKAERIAREKAAAAQNAVVRILVIVGRHG